MATIPEALEIAVQHHQGGRLQAAEQIYRQILAAEPNQAVAIHLLGVIAQQVGKPDEALACYRQALELMPDYAEAHINLGVAVKAQGKLDEAVACYRRALELDPNLAEGHNNLGIALKDQGRLDEAVACWLRALELKPDFIEAHSNLGNALKDQGKLGDAAACYRRAMELKPDFTAAHNNLGNVLRAQGKLEKAADCYRRALELKPDYAEAHNNLGNALRDQGKLEEAAICCRRAMELKPDYAEAHNNLGITLKRQGKFEEAIASYRRALELKPDYAEAHNNLGVVLEDQAKPDEAAACCRRALELRPDYVEAHNNLGNALKEQGNLEAAVACYRRALELKTDYAEVYSNLGATLKDQGKLGEAVACCRRALELKPDYAEAHSNLVYTLIFSPEYDAQTLYEEHRRWNQQHAEPLAKFIQPHPNDRSPARRLNVGYVSPDFRDHVVGRNLLPLFREHDRQQFKVFCYADVPCHDDLTSRFRRYADAWRDTAGLSDAQLSQCIREDGIDILIDLTLHMAHNRLRVFARRPAPVQATFAGYPGTTGLRTIDYRITDPYLDPPGLPSSPHSPCAERRHSDHAGRVPAAACFSEESIRLPDSFWCYDPLDNQPAVNSLPAAEKGYVSFGCLNNFCKINPAMLKIWAQILKAVDCSRLTLLAGEGPHRRHTLDLLEAEGVAADRVTFVGNQPRQHYLKYYHGIDVSLDTVPYNGHTTSLDSLWMGVPVVTLVGPTVVGRAGLSQLMNLGLPELIAASPEQYAHIAAELAQDLPRLGDLRATLRDRMQASPLMNAPRFARNIEAAYREMWRRWCA